MEKIRWKRKRIKKELYDLKEEYENKRNSILEEYKNYNIKKGEKIDITDYKLNEKWEKIKESMSF